MRAILLSVCLAFLSCQPEPVPCTDGCGVGGFGGSGGGPSGVGGGTPSGAGGGRPACVPTKSCVADGKTCGTYYTGCSMVNCGVCAYPTHCGGADYASWKRNEVPNVCGTWM